MGRKQQLISHPRYGLVMQWIAESRRVQARNDWLGLPTAQIPLAWSSQLHAGIADGAMVIRRRPAKVNPNRTAEFVALTKRGLAEWSRLEQAGDHIFRLEFLAAGGAPVDSNPLRGEGASS